MTRAVRWLLVAVLSACGESRSSEDHGAGASNAAGSGGRSAAGGSASGAAVSYFAPGTRLKPQVIALEAGLDVMPATGTDWVDTELGFNCLFVEGDDRVTRCLPQQAQIVYADPGCTAPRVVGILPRSCAPAAPTFVTSEPYDRDDCTQRRQGFRVVGETPFPAELYGKSASGCKLLQRPTGLDILYELEPVPPETFVAMSFTHRPRESALDAYVREGEDGSWQALMFFDPSRGSPCAQSVGDTELGNRCVPYTATIFGFVDAACTTGGVATASVNTCAGRPSLLGRSTLDESTCPPAITTQLFEIGETREVALDYGLSADACVETPRDSAEAFIQGAPVAAQDLPELELFELGSGVVRGRFDGFAGEPYVLARGGRELVDARTGLECEPLAFADGSLRCVPDSFARSNGGPSYYIDADCAGLPVHAWRPSASCLANPPLPVGVVIGQSDARCGGYAITHTRFVVSELTRTELYEHSEQSDTCRAVDVESGIRYLQLGESLDSSELFPELTLELRE